MIFLVFDSVYAPILIPYLLTQVQGIIFTTPLASRD